VGRITKIIEEQTKEKNVEIKKTICDATNQRQLETEKISKEVDLMIIIGGKHSSNTTKLYEISKKYCLKSILVETEKELEIQGLEKNIKIGIMAGASTPKKSIESVVEKIKQIC
jgi:4-hydroxy-3-methylbut-2-enyl diphosphate reductase